MVSSRVSLRFTDELHYTWYKNLPSNFVRPELKPYIFISKDSRLYFSEVRPRARCLQPVGVVNSPPPNHPNLPLSIPLEEK